MTIPAPLAFPPTALRNVAAGLVVGNPVGSSGTRAKALTSAELKAIVEASGISYLPLSGGTLSGALSMPANQSIRWSESNYSRVTSPATTTIDIYSGGFITRFSNGSVSAADWIGIGTDGNSPNVRLYHGGGNVIEQRNGLNSQCFDLFETYTSGTNNGKLRFKATSSGHQIGSARATSGSNRALQLGHFDASNVFTTSLAVETTGNVTLVPLSAVTLSTNGQFSIEMTSNTAGNLVYRGSDGTTRRMALTFS